MEAVEACRQVKSWTVNSATYRKACMNIFVSLQSSKSDTENDSVAQASYQIFLIISEINWAPYKILRKSIKSFTKIFRTPSEII